MAEVPFGLDDITWWLEAPWLKQHAKIKEWRESCFGDCRSESVVLIWFCQQRNDSSVCDMYHALSQASWEVPAKCSTWVTNVKDMGPGFCGVLEALYIWASQYSVVVCVCAHTLEKRGGFFVCVCVFAGSCVCVAICGAVAKAYCETPALVYLSLKISLWFLKSFYLTARHFQWLWTLKGG